MKKNCLRIIYVNLYVYNIIFIYKRLQVILASIKISQLYIIRFKKSANRKMYQLMIIYMPRALLATKIKDEQYKTLFHRRSSKIFDISYKSYLDLK